MLSRHLGNVESKTTTTSEFDCCFALRSWIKATRENANQCKNSPQNELESVIIARWIIGLVDTFFHPLDLDVLRGEVVSENNHFRKSSTHSMTQAQTTTDTHSKKKSGSNTKSDSNTKSPQAKVGRNEARKSDLIVRFDVGQQVGSKVKKHVIELLHSQSKPPNADNTQVSDDAMKLIRVAKDSYDGILRHYTWFPNLRVFTIQTVGLKIRVCCFWAENKDLYFCKELFWFDIPTEITNDSLEEMVEFVKKMTQLAREINKVYRLLQKFRPSGVIERKPSNQYNPFYDGDDKDNDGFDDFDNGDGRNNENRTNPMNRSHPQTMATPSKKKSGEQNQMSDGLDNYEFLDQEEDDLSEIERYITRADNDFGNGFRIAIRKNQNNKNENESGNENENENNNNVNNNRVFCKIFRRQRADARRETAFLSQLQIHPFVVRLLDQFCSDFYNVHILVTEILQPLYCSANGFRRSQTFILSVSEQLVNALDVLHNQHKIIHMDIKPSNLMINADYQFTNENEIQNENEKEKKQEKEPQLKLIDFGLSRVMIMNEKIPLVGTPCYMEPIMREESELIKNNNKRTFAHFYFVASQVTKKSSISMSHKRLTFIALVLQLESLLLLQI